MDATQSGIALSRLQKKIIKLKEKKNTNSIPNLYRTLWVIKYI